MLYNTSMNILTQCYNVTVFITIATTGVQPSEDSDPPVSEPEGATVNSKGSSKRNQGGIWMLIKKLITRDESILIALESDLPLRNSRGESKKAKHSDPSVPKSRRATVKFKAKHSDPSPPNSRGTIWLKKKHSKTSGMSYNYFTYSIQHESIFIGLDCDSDCSVSPLPTTLKYSKGNQHLCTCTCILRDCLLVNTTPMVN